MFPSGSVRTAIAMDSSTWDKTWFRECLPRQSLIGFFVCFRGPARHWWRERRTCFLVKSIDCFCCYLFYKTWKWAYFHLQAFGYLHPPRINSITNDPGYLEVKSKGFWEKMCLQEEFCNESKRKSGKQLFAHSFSNFFPPIHSRSQRGSVTSPNR
jgi:hypothetical protein